MINRIFTIAFLYLKTTYTSRSTLIFAIAMPLLFTFVLGQAMEVAFGPGETPTSWPLMVVDEDNTTLSDNLVSRLEADPSVRVEMTTRSEALTDLEDNGGIAALIIPEGFGEDLTGGNDVTLILEQNAEEIFRAQILAESVNASIAQLSGSFAIAELSVRVAEQVGLFDASNTDSKVEYHNQAFQDAEIAWESGQPIAVTAEAVSRLEDSQVTIPNGASQSSPGMLVMFALFFTFGGGASLLVERDEGTLRRLLVMPMNKATIMGGKLTGIFIGALIQMGIMVLAGQFFFGVSWGQSPPAMIAMLVAYSFTGTALGVMVAALAKTTAQANAASTVVIMALASLGGAWWPIEIVPQWMQQIAKGMPTTWAMQGFHDIITRGLDLSAVLLESGILLGFGLLFLSIAVWRFKYE